MTQDSIVIFQNEDIGELRGFYDFKTNEPWFFAGKVCDCLKIKNSSDALRLLKEKHLRFGQKLDGVDIIYPIITDRLGRKQKTAAISERILYELIFQSRTEKAFLFQQWVFSEVLPAIRKYGSYRTDRKILRRSLTDTIKSEICDKTDNENVKKYAYSQYSILINKSLGLPNKIDDINNLSDEMQIKLAKRQDLVRCLIDEGKSYEEIKRIIENKR